MQGVLIVSADPAVRKSLRLILQPGRAIHERATLAEALSLAAAQRLDLVFVDDVFADGTALGLVEGLHALGYGAEIVPLLLAAGPAHTEPFAAYGVREFLVKPFDVRAVGQVVDR
ncbi:MAG: response regulator, partial [candidate division WOR-3 bacterium]